MRTNLCIFMFIPLTPLPDFTESKDNDKMPYDEEDSAS